MSGSKVLSLEYDLVPGHSLGPFVLGTTLWAVLEYLREAKVSYPQVIVKYDSESPAVTPIVIHILPYVDLLFSTHSQRLRTISLRGLRSSSQGMPLVLRYRNTVLASSYQPLRKGGVAKFFGPTYPGDIMRYPGIWFGFKEDGEDISATIRGTAGDDRGPEVKKIVIQQKNVEDGIGESLIEVSECSVMLGGIRRAVVKPHEGLIVHFYPSNTAPINIKLGDSSEDLFSNLGPPLRVFYKEDDRMEIHSTTRNVTEMEETDYFYNYFQFGIDFLLSGSTHCVKKVILHSNIPGSPTFQRYTRCPWEIHTGSNSESNTPDEAFPKVFTFANKSEALFRFLGQSLSSTPLSMESDQVVDERISLPSSKTQLLGFDGIVAEVYLNHVLTLMLF